MPYWHYTTLIGTGPWLLYEGNRDPNQIGGVGPHGGQGPPGGQAGLMGHNNWIAGPLPAQAAALPHTETTNNYTATLIRGERTWRYG